MMITIGIIVVLAIALLGVGLALWDSWKVRQAPAAPPISLGVSESVGIGTDGTLETAITDRSLTHVHPIAHEISTGAETAVEHLTHAEHAVASAIEAGITALSHHLP
ncbi:MAG: hypothetical protein VKJ24_02510 [Synechococcales bacterium]|nr:hypothetical protein [Synechococcales bacterium]